MNLANLQNKKIKGLDKKYMYGPLNKLEFLNDKKSVYLHFLDGRCECRDLIRHIRNAIAYGYASSFVQNKNNLFKFQDYKTDKITQTALIVITLEQLEKIYDIYSVINKEDRRK